jgi:hypothetical protein
LIKKVACIAIAISVLAACTPKDNPLASFQVLSSSCKAALKLDTDTVSRSDNGGWFRSVYVSGAYMYDVKKSESLVSPYTATIEFQNTTYSAVKNTEEEAKTMPIKSAPVKMENRWIVDYGYEESNWVVKRVQSASKIYALGVVNSPLADSTFSIFSALTNSGTACKPNDAINK